MVMELAKKRKATMLNKSGMLVVIEVWKANILSLRSTSKNSHIYKQMCEELKGHGVILTAVELKNRINNLSRKYSTRDLMDEVIGSGKLKVILTVNFRKKETAWIDFLLC
ncbi:uncharacterized protein LOC129771132 isoform X3 [Toxorhynchites rutilus septentrionalis]|uniref:uncharacterized protein LOC129771132 isoform X3 n=1 Tax=Toxorhynchites rutilus septentrionalis TaxID=329112 RepID=UPI00247A50E2|nr:uncharacterized protein LOC129771132 isoform X3 [Toxorhynchites rutilus septentrionalis]